MLEREFPCGERIVLSHPVFVPAITLGCALGLRKSSIFAIVWVCIVAFLLFFYRSGPPVQVPNMKSTTKIYSPAYGVVKRIRRWERWDQIAIQLRIWDVHVQYAPFETHIRRREHVPGRFDWVFSIEKTDANEHQLEYLDRGCVISRFAGKLTHRIFDIPAENTDGIYQTGAPIGWIALGSRVDLWVPTGSVEWNVKIGDYVAGPHTILGEFL